MLIKDYLLETFQFNDNANRQMISKVSELPEKSECIRLLSHIINSQNKWMARITRLPEAHEMSWWNPLYPLHDMERKWSESYETWRTFLEHIPEEILFNKINFIGQDGEPWEAVLKDIPLQLNYHSIHHRAQIQMIIRAQGFTPDFIDYIGTVYRKL